MPYKIFFFLLIFTFTRTFSQEQEAPPVIVEQMDSTAFSKSQHYLPADSLLLKNPVTENTVFPKTLSPNFRNKYKGPEFDYTTVKPRESLWEKIQRRLIKILRSIFGDKMPQKTNELVAILFRVLAVIIVGLVLYFLISYLLSKDGNFIFGKKNKKVNINDCDLNENIHEINFPASISDYEQKKDFRSAVRYQYLYVLKKLADKKLIEWNPEKTNKDYVAEYSVSASKEQFRELSYIFDYVWYGEFDLNEESYRQFKTKFDNFKI